LELFFDCGIIPYDLCKVRTWKDTNSTVDREVNLHGKRPLFDPRSSVCPKKSFVTKSIVISNLLMLVKFTKYSMTRFRTHTCRTNRRMLANFATRTQGFNCFKKLCTDYTLNFVLNTGILNPLTSPSILWTILFVCTRSCKKDEIHLLY